MEWFRFLRRRLFYGLVGCLSVVLLLELVGPYAVDPAVLMLGQGDMGELERIRHSLGLDRPWYLRGLSGVVDVFTGEEPSYRFHRSSWEVIGERAPITLAIIGWAVFGSMVAGLLLGVAAFRSAIADGFLRYAWGAVLVVPTFVMASLVAAYGARYLATPALRTMVSGLLIGVYGSIWMAHSVRQALDDEFRSLHIKTLRAFGMPHRFELFSTLGNVAHHALGTFDLIAALLLTGGTVVVEYAFHIEGLGLLLLDSIRVMDIPVIRNLLVIAILAYLFINVAAFFVRGVIDPRIWKEEVHGRF